MSNILEIRNVSKSYSSPAGGLPIKVLQDLSLKVRAGEVIAITAPSGAGKSTLLNLIGGLDRPDQGNICFKDQDIAGLSDRELALYRNREIGFVFQEHHLLPQCNVIENVMLPTVPVIAKELKDNSRQRAEMLIEQVGLADRKFHFPTQLSGGERQRTALARALINHPSLLLADEPTGSLDRANATGLMKLLSELNRSQQTTLIIVTHSESLADMADRKLPLSDGKFV